MNIIYFIICTYALQMWLTTFRPITMVNKTSKSKNNWANQIKNDLKFLLLKYKIKLVSLNVVQSISWPLWWIKQVDQKITGQIKKWLKLLLLKYKISILKCPVCAKNVVKYTAKKSVNNIKYTESLHTVVNDT